MTPKYPLQAKTNVTAVDHAGLFELQMYETPITSGYSQIVASDMPSMQTQPVSGA